MKRSLINLALIWVASLGLFATVASCLDEIEYKPREAEVQEHDAEDDFGGIYIEAFLTKHLPIHNGVPGTDGPMLSLQYFLVSTGSGISVLVGDGIRQG